MAITIKASYSALLQGDAAASYATIHNQANADYIYTNDGWVGQAYYESGGARYQVDRNAFIFDTSSLAGLTITGASLDLYGQYGGGGWSNNVGFNIIVVNGADFQNPAVVADYGQLLDDTTTLGTLAIAAGTYPPTSWSITGYNSITLNAVGLALINKTGNTLLAVRSSRDISSTAPTATNPFYEYAEFWCHTDVGKEPRLTIYTNAGEGAGILAVVETRLHYVDAYGVERFIEGTIVT